MTDLPFPRVQYLLESEEEQKQYTYALCGCVDTLTYPYKVPKSTTKNFENFVCPLCNKEINIYVGIRSVRIDEIMA